MSHHNDDIDIEFPQVAPDRLYAHNRRQLSAMLDGELSPDQARFMLRRLQHDTELAACWERWQVCGDVLRGRGHALLPADFSRRVADAIATPAGDSGAATAAAAARVQRRGHRLLRWGGGALAASVALVSLFMARQIPDPQGPEIVEAAAAARPAPDQVDATRLAEVAETVVTPASPTRAPAEAIDAAALLAATAPAVVAVAEVPRRATGRASTRSQVQRAALRRGQGADAPARTAVAAAAPLAPPMSASQAPVLSASLPVLAAGSSAHVTPEGEALFGGPAAEARPWPRAVLPGLSRGQPFAAGYGLPQAEAFAPFQPRLGVDRASPARPAMPPSGAAGTGAEEADPASGPRPGETD
ncbi:sigma-E factor negative regulatory protein [Luteimonas sp. MC1895]|uniref:sigma-E factor negative regulatory protein n=1 Tax=Luteimonas sp. MC1895 TaxID=2819513 RepID=UPI0018F0B466|nr:sigma-E factor negative regulatory protein [Luteimonas sp. MC1895]MBJ6979569.1 sigma-E factor negative regulatory protein [Luteimonas sp. MC1895]